MADYREYTEQLERLQELLMAMSYLITSMTPEDLELWTKMKEHLSSREVLEDQIVAGDIEQLKQMTDTLSQILAKHRQLPLRRIVSSVIDSRHQPHG